MQCTQKYTVCTVFTLNVKNCNSKWDIINKIKKKNNNYLKARWAFFENTLLNVCLLNVVNNVK